MAVRTISPLLCSLSSSAKPSTRRLILTLKRGCCLCDDLKEKLHAAFSLSCPDSLNDFFFFRLEISLRIPKGKELISYQYEIPVLAKENSDGKEEILPRLSPRLSVEIIQNKLLGAFKLISYMHDRGERRRKRL